MSFSTSRRLWVSVLAFLVAVSSVLFIPGRVEAKPAVTIEVDWQCDTITITADKDISNLVWRIDGVDTKIEFEDEGKTFVLDDTIADVSEISDLWVKSGNNGGKNANKGKGVYFPRPDPDPCADSPIAADDDYSTDEDTPLNVAAAGVLGNDTDSDPLTANLLTGPTNGILSLSLDGSFDYTSNLNYNGPDIFTYEACDPGPLCDSATVTITVLPGNDPPDAVDDSYSTDEDTALNVAAPGVLGNDSDVDGDVFTVTGSTGPPNGALTLNSDGSFDYTPNLNYNGPDSFTYTISDGNGAFDTATVALTVNPVNDPPVADAGSDQIVPLGSNVVLDGSGSSDPVGRRSPHLHLDDHLRTGRVHSGPQQFDQRRS